MVSSEKNVIIKTIITIGGVHLNCPKCGVKISPFDLKPNCKNCGVNILIYSQEYLLERDAKRTELEFASGRIVLAKIKKAFIGGALPIARLVTLLLCVAALLIPFADFGISTPAFSTDISLGGIGIYNLFSGDMLSTIPAFAGSVLFGTMMKKVLILLGIILLIALCDVALLLTEILSFINIKKSAKAMRIISAVGFALCAVFYIAGFVVNSTALASYMSFSLGFGALAAAIMFAVFFFINSKIAKSDLQLKVREFDFERKEILDKVKKGEIDLDDLSLPVFETEEEKEQRLKELEEILKADEEGG